MRATLDLVEEQGGVRGVNLRRITKRVGCAHTNAYNYFGSLEDLFWAARCEGLRDLVEAVEQHKPETPELTAFAAHFAERQIDFAIQHPGLYRFLWLESLGGSPPPELAVLRLEMAEGFVGDLVFHSGGRLSRSQLLTAVDVMHGYLHGEICKMLTGTTISTESDRVRQIVVRNFASIPRWVEACEQ